MLSFGFTSPTLTFSNWRLSPALLLSDFRVKSKSKSKDKSKDKKSDKKEAKVKAKAKESMMEWTGAINGLSCGLNIGAARMSPLGAAMSIGGSCLTNYLFTNVFFPKRSPRFATFAVPCLAGFFARKAFVPFPKLGVLCDRLNRYAVVGGTALNLGMCVKKCGKFAGLLASVAYYLLTHVPATSHRNTLVSWMGILAGAAVYLRLPPENSARRALGAVAASCAVCVGVERAIVHMRGSDRYRGLFESLDRSVRKISESFEDPMDAVDVYPYYFAVPPVPFYSLPYGPFDFFYF